MTNTAPKTTLPPGPSGYPFIGILPKMWGNSLDFFQQSAAEYGDVVLLNFGNRKGYLFNNPDDIQYILQTNYRNFQKSTTVSVVPAVLGAGLATNEGDSWLKQRRLMQPAFHKENVQRLGDAMIREASRLFPLWDSMAAGSAPINIFVQMMRLTQNIIVQTMFGGDIHDRAARVGDAWSTVLRYFNQSAYALVQIPSSWPTRRNREFHAALDLLNRETSEIIEKAAALPPDETPDLLALLLAARDEEGGGMSSQQLRDEIMTIFLAGHETTADTLTWTFYLLAQNPAVRAKLHAELDAVLGGRLPTIGDLPKLEFTGNIVQEAVRLYPPFWLIYRTPVTPDEIAGYKVEPGDYIFICPYVIHRDPKFWDTPNTFNPDRFPAEPANKLAYIPFGAGPRRCIGEQMALMEATLSLASIAQRYQFDLYPGETVTPEPQVTLRPKGGIRMTIKRR
jgi:cytochrome P450